VAAAALLLCASGFGAESKAPSASAIVDRYIEKLGGQDALDKVKSRTLKGELVGPENPVPWTEYTQEGQKRSWKLEIPNASPMMRVVDGEKGWAKSPDGSVTDLEGEELAREKRGAAFRHRLNPKGIFDLTYEKSETQGGDTILTLKASTPGGTDRLSFSEKTGLLVRYRSEWDSGSSSYEEQLEDYRPVEGVQFPFTRKARLNDFEFTLKYSDVKQNQPIDSAVFAKPKAD
jgi:hypothetical protein